MHLKNLQHADTWKDIRGNLIVDFVLKGVLRSIFCVDINTHSVKKSIFLIDIITPLFSSTQIAFESFLHNLQEKKLFSVDYGFYLKKHERFYI